jgi:hypothetical protein
MRLFILLAALAAAPASLAGQLKPFATDGCSMWVDGTPANPNLISGAIAASHTIKITGWVAARQSAKHRMSVCGPAWRAPVKKEWEVICM